MTSVEGAADERVGPYRLLALLGEGGMGVVHRAVDDEGRDVAVKLVRPEFAKDDAFRSRLAREVDTMRRIRSPYVAEVLDADVLAERPYIVTRFIDGMPLDDAVRADGPLTGGPLARVAVGLADALTAIHEAGIVHRDLKPNNVMLVGGAPVVIDFGIAHAVDATRLTRTGMVVGTPGYMGPELIDGGRPGPALDVYGWAATVTYAAIGRSPYGSGSLEAVLSRIIAGDPDLVGVPPRLEPFLRTALERDPELRPTAAELAVRVRAADIGAPITAAHTSPDPLTVPDASPEETRRPPVVPASIGVPPRRRVSLRTYKLVAYVAIVAAALASALYPLLGAAGVLAAAGYLRAGDFAVRSRRFQVRGLRDLLIAPVRTAGGLTWSALLFVPCVLYAAVAAALLGGAAFLAGGRDAPGSVAEMSVIAFGYVTLAGPGVMAPRRQTVRLLSALARGRTTTALAGVALALVAAVACRRLWIAEPHWWPLSLPYHRIGALAHTLWDLARHR
jgi:hypothetical protein